MRPQLFYRGRPCQSSIVVKMEVYSLPINLTIYCLSSMDTLRGHLLIAEPRLPDPNFFRTVVLLIEHTENGATGLILNRPGDIQLSEIWHEVSTSPLERDETIYNGGPVSGPLTILHDRSNFSEEPLMDGLHLSMKRDNLQALLTTEDIQMRLFSGYSGWGPGQLEQEMQVGGWLTWPGRPEHVFLDPDQLYKSVCDTIGQDLLFGQRPLKHRPNDPTLN